jgi:hypothetical protein
VSTSRQIVELTNKIISLDNAVVRCSDNGRFDMAEIWRTHRDSLIKKEVVLVKEFVDEHIANYL